MWEMDSRQVASSSSSSSSAESSSPRTMRPNSEHRRRASSGVLPWTRSLIMSAEPWLTAQPVPVQLASEMVPSSPTLTWSMRSSPQLGLMPSWVQVASSMA